MARHRTKKNIKFSASNYQNRANRKKRNLKGKRKESNFVKSFGKFRAIQELQDESTIYMLGEDPTYIHSRNIYFKEGLETTSRAMHKKLNNIAKNTKVSINNVCKVLDDKMNEVYKALNIYTGVPKNDFQTFRILWEKEIEPYNLDDGNQEEQIYLLALLNQIKRDANLISKYLSTRKNSITTEQAKVKALISLGFINADIHSKDKLEDTMDGDAIKAIRKQQRENIAILIPKLESLLAKKGEAFNWVQREIDKIKGKDINQSFAIPIGKIFEFLSDGYSKALDSGIQITLEHSAAENIGKNSKAYKADTKAIIGQTTLLLSDKTGQDLLYNKNTNANKDMQTIDIFTQELALGLGKVVNQKTVLFNDAQVTSLYNYVMRNSIQRKDGGTNVSMEAIKEAKNWFIKFLIWWKVVVMLVGRTKNIQDYPPVVRVFNRLYLTSDILKQFLEYDANDERLIEIINQSQLGDFYKKYDAPAKMSELFEEKKSILKNESKNGMSYRKLKYSDNVMNLIQTINAGLPIKSLSTSFRINLTNLYTRI